MDSASGSSLARRLVELHGGRIEVASEGTDRGSVFTCAIYPRRASLPAAAPRGGAEDAAAMARPRRVLVVDDNRDAADSLAMILEMSGTEVAVAYDGAQALVLVEEDDARRGAHGHRHAGHGRLRSRAADPIDAGRRPRFTSSR